MKYATIDSLRQQYPISNIDAVRAAGGFPQWLSRGAFLSAHDKDGARDVLDRHERGGFTLWY